MEIILLKDIEKLGDAHEVVKVKPGYARNFLIPQGFAITANAKNMAKLDDLKSKQAAEEQKYVDAAKEMAAKIEGKVLKIATKAGTSGKIFGSVNNVQIAQALKEQLGVDVERKNVELMEEVKNIGTYSATVKFHKQVSQIVSFEVVEG